MLVLSRKENQQLIIGDNIVVHVMRVAGGKVRLGIAAPHEVSIRREELAKLQSADPNAKDCLGIGRSLCSRPEAH